MLCEVYIDESYDSLSPPLLCLAAYVYARPKAREFEVTWARFLAARHLPYFHMSECAHGEGVFRGRADCDFIARRLIQLTRKYTELGIALAINEDDYAQLVGGLEGMRTGYAFALAMMMHHIASWRRRNAVTGPTHFFFEQGHKHQGDASQFLDFLLGSRDLRTWLNYGGHTFVEKERPQLHPADNLAWHWRLEAKRRRDPQRRAPRKDFLALCRAQDCLYDYSRFRLEQFAAEVRRGEIERGAIIKIAEATGVLPS